MDSAKKKELLEGRGVGPSDGISTGRAGAPSTRLEVELYIPAQFIDSCVFLG